VYAVSAFLYLPEIRSSSLSLSSTGSTQTIEHLQRLHSEKDLVADVNIPLEVIKCVFSFFVFPS
jgi:hypothetical protein